MQNIARHNTTGSTERHWIPGQEAKSINRGEVNSTHACLTGAQTVAMVIREGWPHFLELVFHSWTFPRKTELIFFVWLFYWFSILSFLTLRGSFFPQFQEHPPWLYVPPTQASSLSHVTSSSGTCLGSHLLFTSLWLGNKCDWKASMSPVWLMILPLLPYILGVGRGGRTKEKKPPYSPMLARVHELGPYHSYCLWCKCLSFSQPVNKTFVLRE